VSLVISDCVLLSASADGGRFPRAHIFANIIARRNAAVVKRRHAIHYSLRVTYLTSYLKVTLMPR